MKVTGTLLALLAFPFASCSTTGISTIDRSDVEHGTPKAYAEVLAEPFCEEILRIDWSHEAQAQWGEGCSLRMDKLWPDFSVLDPSGISFLVTFKSEELSAAWIRAEEVARYLAARLTTEFGCTCDVVTPNDFPYCLYWPSL